MTELSQKHCEPCRVGAPTLTSEQISNLKPQIPNWEVIEEGGIKKLMRKFKFKDFAQTLNFVDRISRIAEEEDHHPEIAFGWGHAKITWWTHKIGGLHQNDFVMAAKTDELS